MSCCTLLRLMNQRPKKKAKSKFRLPSAVAKRPAVRTTRAKPKPECFACKCCRSLNLKFEFDSTNSNSLTLTVENLIHLRLPPWPLPKTLPDAMRFRCKDVHVLFLGCRILVAALSQVLGVLHPG